MLADLECCFVQSSTYILLRQRQFNTFWYHLKSDENCKQSRRPRASGDLLTSSNRLVRDSSAVRRLFSICCSRGTSESSTYGKQRICPPTLGQHISTFRGYLILFSIRNPYINRFTNHFSIHL